MYIFAMRSFGHGSCSENSFTKTGHDRRGPLRGKSSLTDYAIGFTNFSKYVDLHVIAAHGPIYIIDAKVTWVVSLVQC